jgi:Fic family protein
METVYLAKGALGSAAIEGNSLSEAQAVAAVEGNLKLPQSQAYLQQELENVIKTIHGIEEELHRGGSFEISPKNLRDLNRLVLADLVVEDHVVPGEFRTSGITVGNVYKGAPAVDCEFLVEVLCDWLNGPDFRRNSDDPARSFLNAILRAAIAHVYIAWIHPFGDGNGRTARLVEFGILAGVGIPSVAAHLLSNHYNATRSNYYRQLNLASKSGGDLVPFLSYAAEGFVDELQQQLNEVHESIVQATWINYVHSVFPDRTVTARRQRDLVLALPPERFVPRGELPTLTPPLAEAYAGKQAKTVTRDLNALANHGLIERGPKGVRARREVMLSFMPRVAPGADDDRSELFPELG